MYVLDISFVAKMSARLKSCKHACCTRFIQPTSYLSNLSHARGTSSWIMTQIIIIYSPVSILRRLSAWWLPIDAGRTVLSTLQTNNDRRKRGLCTTVVQSGVVVVLIERVISFWTKILLRIGRIGRVNGSRQVSELRTLSSTTLKMRVKGTQAALESMVVYCENYFICLV